MIIQKVQFTSKLLHWTQPVYGLGTFQITGSAKGIVVYQYTRKKFAKIPKNTQNSSKYTQNYSQVYFIPEIQRK